MLASTDPGLLPEKLLAVRPIAMAALRPELSWLHSLGQSANELTTTEEEDAAVADAQGPRPVTKAACEEGPRQYPPTMAANSQSGEEAP